MKRSVWLPSRKRLERVGQWVPIAELLARADRLPDAPPGRVSLIEHDFACTPNAISEAALGRHADRGDAAHASWLRADPVHLGADQSALRLMAFGDLGLDLPAAQDFAAVLKPLFGDVGYEFDVAAPDRWYLRLLPGSEVPKFSPPEQVLGDRLDPHLPGGTTGLRWQRLMTEAQMSLHAHRRNADRLARGLLPINSLWFWGGGRLPNRVVTTVLRVVSDDIVVTGLARHAGLAHESDVSRALSAEGSAHDLFDFRSAFADPALAESILGRLATWRQTPLRIAIDSGERFLLKPWHRWRFWRKRTIDA